MCLHSLGAAPWVPESGMPPILPGCACLHALFSQPAKNLPTRIYLLTAFTKLRSCFLSSTSLTYHQPHQPGANSSSFLSPLCLVSHFPCGTHHFACCRVVSYVHLHRMPSSRQLAPEEKASSSANPQRTWWQALLSGERKA